jgi:hypothetical protein
MKNWQVTVKMGDQPDDILELIDIKEVFEGYLNVSRTFFDELLSIVKMIKKYAIGKGVEVVKAPDGSDWTHNPWILMLLKDNEKSMPFWLLFKREKDLSGYLVAAGPEQFIDYCKATKEADDEIKRIMEYMIAYPQKFTLSIIIPNFIA